MTDKQIDVKTSVGTFTIVKPKAGKRNRALIKAEISNGIIKHSVLTEELLPGCISSRPENFDKSVPIEHVLNDLEIEDYDLLATALIKIIQEHETPEAVEEKKT